MPYLLLASFLWGTSFIAGKIAYDMLDPSLTVVFRLVIASLLLLPFTISFFKDNSGKTSKKDIAQLIFLGLLTYPITFMLQFVGLSLTSASSATTIIGVEPVMVAIIGLMFFKDRASPLIFLLGLVAFIGVLLMVGVSPTEDISLLGCLLVFLSTIVVAFWLRLSKQMLATMKPMHYTALTVQLGTLVGSPIIFLFVKDWQINYSLKGILALLYLGIGCSLLAGWLWNKGLEVTASNKSGFFLALEPVFGVLLAVLLLGERLDMVSIVGICLVVLSAGVCVMLPAKEQT